MRCGTIRRALCANKRPNCSRHVAQKAQCARPRCAKAPSRRTGHGGCPRLANVARARERAVCRTTAGKCMTRTTPTCPKIRHLILKCPNTHERAQLASRAGTQIPYASSSWRYMGLGKARENRNQTESNAAQKSNNQIPLVIPPLGNKFKRG